MTRAGIVAALVACTVMLPAQTVVRGPYLQRGTPTSVVVKWRTDVATDGRVTFGTTQALGSQVSAAGQVTNHAITLSGLAPDTLYYYAVGTTGQTLVGGSDCFFVTSPIAGTRKPTRIWVLGDSGSQTTASPVRDAYLAFAGSRHTDLWMMLGDNAYVDGTDAEYQLAVFVKFAAMLKKSVLWPTLGNHDGHSASSANQTGPYYDIFTLPTQGEAGGLPSNTEAYYSFDYANVHFVCLDSYETPNTPGSPMLLWLAADLAATTQEWVIAFWHHPPYTKGTHDSDSESELIAMRQNVCPILEAYGVDLVLCGHSHVYERSKLIDGHYGSSSTFGPQNVIAGGDGQIGGAGAWRKPATWRVPHAGCAYVVMGSSSSSGTNLALNHPAMFHSEATPGSVVLDVDGDQLDLRFIDTHGVTKDRFTMMKGAPTAIDRVHEVFPPFATWKYHDAGVDLGTAWRAASYPDGSWASGPGTLGFGEPYIATTVSSGPPQNVHPTKYFRKTFTVPVDLELVDSARLYANYDDGFAAWLNGQLVAQSPSLTGSSPTYAQLATAHEGGVYDCFAIPTSALLPGPNVLAVEVHQVSATSSDLVWDASVQCDAFVPLLGAFAPGNAGPGGAPADVLLLNGSSGGHGRGIDLPAAAQLTIAVSPPPPAASANFALFVSLGTPGPLDAFALPLGIGTMCFPPSLLAPSPTGIYFASSLGPDPTLYVLAPPAPWSLTLTHGFPAGTTAAIQGVISDATSALRVTNGVLITVVP